MTTIDVLETDAATGAEALVTAERYRHVLGHFVTGVTVVTGMDAGEPVGFTCQSFSAVSLQPPLILVSPATTSTSWPRVAASGRFAVNVLAHDQHALGRGFAKSGADKFAGVDWAPGPQSGAPLLAGSVGWIECAIETVHEAGDHWLVIGRVLDLGVADGDAAPNPLTFFRGALAGLSG